MNELLVSDNAKSDLLNEYFSSIHDRNHVVPIFAVTSEQQLQNIRVKRNDVSDVLKVLKLDKATGRDSISAHKLKLTTK